MPGIVWIVNRDFLADSKGIENKSRQGFYDRPEAIFRFACDYNVSGVLRSDGAERLLPRCRVSRRRSRFLVSREISFRGGDRQSGLARARPILARFRVELVSRFERNPRLSGSGSTAVLCNLVSIAGPIYGFTRPFLRRRLNFRIYF